MGKLLIVEFSDEEETAFEKVIQLLRYDYGFPGDREIPLTSKEFGILCILAANKERTVSCEQIYQKVWGNDPDKGINKIISYHIRNLRKKLDMDISKSPLTIQCVREVGYLAIREAFLWVFRHDLSYNLKKFFHPNMRTPLVILYIAKFNKTRFFIKINCTTLGM